jgi:outer membrane autotransporter protein
VPSSTTTAATVLRAATQAVAGQVSSRIQAALPGTTRSMRLSANEASFEKGIAAGENTRIGVWGSVELTKSEDDFPRTAFDSHLLTCFVGADVSHQDKVVLGVALGYEDNDIETPFNLGSQDVRGFTIASYVGYLFSKRGRVDLALGLLGTGNQTISHRRKR